MPPTLRLRARCVVIWAFVRFLTGPVPIQTASPTRRRPVPSQELASASASASPSQRSPSSQLAPASVAPFILTFLPARYPSIPLSLAVCQMFTPPPSPDPRSAKRTSSTSTAVPSDPALKLDVSDDLFLSPSSSHSRSISPDSLPPQSHETPLSPKEDPYTYAQVQKKRAGRRTRWTVVLVPLVLIFIALSTRYLTHPVAFDALSSRSSSWSSVKDWTPHKRHAAPDPVPATSVATTVDNSQPTGTDLSLAPSATSAPTQVDSSNTKVPWTAPVLPTPFPQPFDSTLSTNFTTVGCQDFILNMTQTAPFRECRPFSLLVGDSNAFITVSLFDLPLVCS